MQQGKNVSVLQIRICFCLWEYLSMLYTVKVPKRISSISS